MLMLFFYLKVFSCSFGVYLFALQVPYDGGQAEIQDMETVRGQLHQLLTMSEHNLSLIHI